MLCSVDWWNSSVNVVTLKRGVLRIVFPHYNLYNFKHNKNRSFIDSSSCFDEIIDVNNSCKNSLKIDLLVNNSIHERKPKNKTNWTISWHATTPLNIEFSKKKGSSWKEWMIDPSIHYLPTELATAQI